MYKGIIFDLDGTLLNTIRDLNNSVNDTYKYFSYPKQNSEEETMSLVGHGMRNLIKSCFPNKDEDFIDEALKVFLDFYDKKYYEYTRPYKGITSLIDILIEKNYKLGVNSNKNHNYTKHLIELNFPNMNLEYVKGIKAGDKTKPDPTNILKTIEEMNLSSKEIIYVGDSPTDVKTAQNANLKSVGVSWGFRPKEKLIEAGVDLIIDEPHELLKILGE